MTTPPHSDLNSRIERYAQLMKVEYDEYKPHTFDPQEYISRGFDELKHYCEFNNLYVCGRANKCRCNTDCMCDDDNYFKITTIHTQCSSNSKAIFEFRFDEPIGFGKLKGLRFFAFTNDNNHEVEKPILDIVHKLRRDRKNKNKIIIRSSHIVFPSLDSKIIFPLNELPRINIRTKSIEWNVSYMNYVHLDE